MPTDHDMIIRIDESVKNNEKILGEIKSSLSVMQGKLSALPCDSNSTRLSGIEKELWGENGIRKSVSSLQRWRERTKVKLVLITAIGVFAASFIANKLYAMFIP